MGNQSDEPLKSHGTETPHDKEYWSNKTWFWGALFIAATFTLLVGSYTYYRHESNRIRQEKYQELAAIANLKSLEIQHWREDRLKDAEAVAQDPLFTKAVNEWIVNRGNNTIPEDLTKRLITTSRMRDYVDAVLLSADGQPLLSASRDPKPISETEEKAVQDALINRSPMLTDLYRAPDDTILLSAVAPLLDPEGQPTAMVLLRSDPEMFFYPLVESWPTPSRSAETLLARREADHILSITRFRHKTDSVLRFRDPLTKTYLPAVQAALGRTGIFEGRDYRGNEVLADLRRIPDSPWFMVAKVDTSEILAEARYRGTVIALFAVVFVLLTASATAYGFRSRQSRLYRKLYRSEYEQREAQERYRNLVEMSSDAIVIHQDREIVFINSAGARMLGAKSPEELVGKSIQAIVHPDYRDSVADRIRRLLKGEDGLFPAENWYVKLDGSVFPAELTASLLSYRNRPAVQVVARDITERKKAEEALRESEEKYRNFFDTSRDAVFMTALDGRFVDFNQAGLEVLGYATNQRQELLQRRVSDFYAHPEQRETHAAVVSRHGFSIEYPVDLRCLDGRIISTLITTVTRKDAEGKVVGFQGTVRDITESKQAEEALRESEAKYRSLVERLPAITYTAALDETSATTYVSPQIEQAIGYSPAEYQLDPDIWVQRLHPDDRQRVLEELARSHEEGVPFSCRYRMIAREGSIRWFNDGASVVHDEGGKPLCLQGVMVDMVPRYYVWVTERSSFPATR